MSKTYTIGLGEPQPEGKLALFKPSMEREETRNKIPHPPAKAGQGTRRRVRTTIELSTRALVIIQEMQNRHRLETGRVHNYKLVNDTHGHTIGDRVLEEIAAHCNKQLRKGDIIGRYGGDEFSILLPETQLPLALDVAERLRQISLKSFEAEQKNFTVSISLGVAVLKDSTASLEDLLNNADCALYKAKELGGNCICIDEG